MRIYEIWFWHLLAYRVCDKMSSENKIITHISWGLTSSLINKSWHYSWQSYNCSCAASFHYRYYSGLVILYPFSSIFIIACHWQCFMWTARLWQVATDKPWKVFSFNLISSYILAYNIRIQIYIPVSTIYHIFYSSFLLIFSHFVAKVLPTYNMTVGLCCIDCIETTCEWSYPWYLYHALI